MNISKEDKYICGTKCFIERQLFLSLESVTKFPKAKIFLKLFHIYKYKKHEKSKEVQYYGVQNVSYFIDKLVKRQILNPLYSKSLKFNL